MDFFEQQDNARRRTSQLIVFFSLAVVATIVAVYAVVVFALMMQADSAAHHKGVNVFLERLWNPELFVIVALLTSGGILLSSLYKMAQLSSGGEVVALMMGGRLLDSQTHDPAERRLLNVVEEMALASGTPVPPVYLLDKESSINAFAAGHETDDAVIGVSAGSLKYLNRDELQGVIAHEFSHILNGDMRLNLRLIGILHGILVLAIIGWRVIRLMRFSGRSRSKSGGSVGMAIFIVGLGLLVTGSIGLLFGKLIKSAVSRQREYLADAAAVQFTRLPAGIAGALKKIGGQAESAKINDPHAEEISHMFFSNAFGGRSLQFFATHPPLIERIQRIDPSFTGQFPERVEPVEVSRGSLAAAMEREARPGQAVASRAPLAGETAPSVDPVDILGEIGLPDKDKILYAGGLLESIPALLRDAAHEPYGARAVIYAVLLDRDAAIQRQQLEILRVKAEELSCRETERMAPQIRRLPDATRLPLVETTFPALKRLSPRQYAQFRANVKELIQADAKIDLLEYTIHSMLLRNLDVHFGLSKRVTVRQRRLKPLLPALIRLLSLLAYEGQGEADLAAVQGAFAKGMSHIQAGGTLLARADCSLKTLDSTLRSLAEAVPNLKKQIFAACMACVAADNRITPREGELLQSVAANLGLPMPSIKGIS